MAGLLYSLKQFVISVSPAKEYVLLLAAEGRLHLPKRRHPVHDAKKHH